MPPAYRPPSELGGIAGPVPRRPRLAGTPFFARFDPAATWLTDLEPAFADRFPYEPAGYGEAPGALPRLGPKVPDEPGELMVPAI
jgi:hypothetical protein